ncbi:hypothetical protein H5T87_03725 [bacterium]|nr:hypothetical protein [bacterium]
MSNGGFEELKNGFPTGWIGYTAGKGQAEVKLTKEAHSGNYAILLKAKRDSVAGLNRTYPIGKKGEEQSSIGDLFPRLKGAFTFWFKLKKAEGDNVRFYVIPMGKDNYEIGPARTTFVIPPLFADDKWHFGIIAYDYTKMPDVRSVQVAPRINEGGNGDGELIIDDVNYVESAGPFLLPLSVDISKDSLTLRLKNVGDEEAKNLTAKLSPPAGIRIDSPEKSIDLKSGEEGDIKWKLEGESKGKVAFTLSWHPNPQIEDSVTLSAVYEPSLIVKEFSTKRAIHFRGDSYNLHLLLANDGLGSAQNVNILISAPPSVLIKPSKLQLPLLPASSQEEQTFELKPLQDGLHKLKLAITWQGGKLEKELYLVVSKHLPHFSWGKGASIMEENGDLVIQNENLRLVFPKNSFGYGVFALDVKDMRAGYMRMAISPYLANLIYRRRIGKEANALLYAQSYEKKEKPGEVELIFPLSFKDDDGVLWKMSIRFTAKSGQRSIDVDWALSAEHSVQLLAIHCPRLYIGEGEFGSDKDYALFPGLFYMLKGESSISTEFGDPPFNDQHAPHPYKITVPMMTLVKDKHLVGIMWDPLQKWDGVNVCPSALFASPNWLEGQDNHLFGLFLPSIPRWVKENEEKASEPFILNPQVKLSLHYWLIGGYPLDITDSFDFYLEKFGIPPLPQRVRNYDLELQLCGFPDIPPRYLRLVGQINSLAQQCALDMSTQREDGSWGFKMDPQNTEMLRKFNPKRPNLGAEGDTSIGTCTFLNRRATALLRYTRFTNNQLTWEAGLKALNYITDHFTRPEGAQTWEIPLHAPDILASANGVLLYLEAYKLTGDKEYLKRAIFWAKTGLPFVYVWNAPDRPRMMLYATIPIFGVSFYNAAPWFGTPVQWCGLDYAYSLLKLAQYDDSYPWKHIAEGITLCAMQMQTTEGEHKGGYPDSVNLMTYTKSDPGMLNPAGIARNVYILRNPEEDPQDNSFFLLFQNNLKIMVNSEAPSINAKLDGDNLLLTLKSPRSIPGKPISTYTTVAPIERPIRVLRNGREISQNIEEEEWWRYDERNGGLLIIKVKHDEPFLNLRIEGVKAKENRTPLLTAKPDWEFNVDNDPEGWSETHDLAPFNVSGGTLKGRSIGGDPYMESPFFRVSANEYPYISLRMKFNPLPPGAVPDAQIFWAREDETSMTEQKSIHFPIIADGEWHTYNVRVADSPEWKGTIVQIRLDPGSGTGIQFEIDWIRLSPTPL